MTTNQLTPSDDLASIFDDCLERLAAGQSLNDCLALYPRYAAQLRVLLETRAAVRRARATPQEVAAAQERIRFRLQGYRRRAVPTFDWRRLASIAALLVLLLLGGLGLQRAMVMLSQPTATATAQATFTATPTATMTASETITSTATISPTATASATLQPSSTPIVSPTNTDLLLPTTTMVSAPITTPISTIIPIEATRRPTQPPSKPPNPPPTSVANPTDDHSGPGNGGDDHGGGPGPNSGSGSGGKNSGGKGSGGGDN